MQTNNKLREALTKILNLTNSLDEDCAVDPVEIRDIAKAALSAPPRNCDIGTVKELNVRYNKFCYAHRQPENGCGGCPLDGEPCCELAWAQMLYEEGGAK